MQQFATPAPVTAILAIPAGRIQVTAADRADTTVDIRLWVPRTSSALRDQAILVDQTTNASLSSDLVMLKIDWLGRTVISTV
jgi:hypothetical protein